MRGDLKRILNGEEILLKASPETETVVRPKSSIDAEEIQIARFQPNPNNAEDNFLQSPINDVETVVRPITAKNLKTAKQRKFWLNPVLLIIELLFIGLFGFYIFNTLRDMMPSKAIRPYSNSSNSINPMNPSTDMMNSNMMAANSGRNIRINPNSTQMNSSYNTMDSPTMNSNTMDTTTIPCKGRIYNQNGNVKLRSFPGLNSDNTIMELSDGSSIQIEEFSPNGKWVRIITIGGVEGWISSGYFRCESADGNRGNF